MARGDPLFCRMEPEFILRDERFTTLPDRVQLIYLRLWAVCVERRTEYLPWEKTRRYGRAGWVAAQVQTTVQATCRSVAALSAHGLAREVKGYLHIPGVRHKHKKLTGWSSPFGEDKGRTGQTVLDPLWDRESKSKSKSKNIPPYTPPSGGKRVSPSDDEFLEAWKALPDPIPKPTRWSPKRKKALASRRRDEWWREHWREAVERIPACPFLLGEGSTGWVADVDWFLKPDSAARVLEGKYGDRKAAAKDEILHMELTPEDYETWG